MDAVTGAVVIAGLTTVGKPTIESLTAIIGKILSPSADALGQGIAVPIQVWAKRRAERASQTLLEAASLLHQAQADPRPVPGRILMPIIEHSSIEEDEQLRTRWATLLANAAVSQDAIVPGFADVLSQLTGFEARILNWMHSNTGILNIDGPNAADGSRVFSIDEVLDAFEIGITDYNFIASDLHRLQIIDGRRTVEPSYFNTKGESDTTASHYSRIGLTPFGVRFVLACYRPPGQPRT